MKRYFKPLLVLTALLIALTLTIYRSGSQGLAGLQVGADRPSRAAAVDTGGKPYDLTHLRILIMTLQRIRDNYVDPTRIDPRGMLLAALDHVQRNVAEVLFEPRADKNEVSVRVDTAQQVFNIANVDSPWALSTKLKEIFKFVQGNLPPGSDTRDIEYHAINGMLSTLDPHSVLLDPNTYREMKIDTRGKFGGLGIEISIRGDMLTVVGVLPGTPASRAGLKPGDRILRINDESTINMLLTEAVSRLRGDPGTKVTIYIEREGQSSPKKTVLERAIIDMQYVVGTRILKNGVGYVHIKQFAGNTSDDLRRSLSELHRQGMKALVLDLRNNPGGLLEQAIKVSDAFIETGTLVTTVGYAGKQREEKRARAEGTEPHIPMVVLVDSRSASASEIVAGALKNLDRAVIVGQTTFGKGSVQVLYDNDDESALKLTIAQYLTPGDVSIQSVGITPDVQTIPVHVGKDGVAFSPPQHLMIRESELEQHLDSRNTKRGEKPEEIVRYLAPEPKKAAAGKGKVPPKNKDLDDEDGEDADGEPPPPPLSEAEKIQDDFDIEFARDLLMSVPQGAWRRREVLAGTKAFFEKTRVGEDQKIGTAIGKLGVDWTLGSVQGAPRLVASLSTDHPNNRVAAGDSVKVRINIKNDGSGAAEQVRGKIKSDDYLFDEREFVLGRVRPGETKTTEVAVKIPKHSLSEVEELQLQITEGHGAKIEPAMGKLQIDGLPRPVFAYTYQIIDDLKGNGDGKIERGEHVRLLVTVKNLGPGRAYKTQATLKNNSGAGVLIHKGRFRIDNLAAGQTKQVVFDLEVGPTPAAGLPEFQEETLQLELAVADQVLHEVIDEKLKFPVVAQGTAPETASGNVAPVRDHVEVRATPAPDGTVIGYLGKSGSLHVTGKTADYLRVDLEPGRPAFIAAAQMHPSSAGASTTFEPTWMVSPPQLTLAPNALETAEGKIRLRGTARDERRVGDIYVIVANRASKIEYKKVFYKSNRKGQDPRRLDFDAEVPLWPGENYVRVVARENPQVQSQQTLVVLRTGATQVASPQMPGQQAQH